MGRVLRGRVAGLFGDHVVEVVRAGIEAGEFAPVPDPRLTRALMVGVMQAGVQLISSGALDRCAVAETAAQFLVNALAGPHPVPRPSG